MKKNYISKEKKLIILDISGILCGKESNFDVEHPDLKLIHITNYYRIFLRPGALQFVKRCLENYDVGIFSSTTYPNVKPVLNSLFGYIERKKLKFIWCRDRCELDPDYKPNSGEKNEENEEKINKYDTIKILKRIIDNPCINLNRKYNLDNILMFDDSIRKMRFNPKGSYSIIEEFKLDPKDQILEELWLGMELEKKCSI